MFIVRTERKVKTFYLDDQRDVKEFEDLLNNPGVNVIDRKYQTQSETTMEGESRTIIERPFVRVEYEVCSL